MNTYILLCILLLVAGTAAAPSVLNVAYCGFGINFCGDSISDDVYSRTNNVILAYANIANNGVIYIDTDNYPRNQIINWKNTGKRIFLSIGGPKADWTYVYASETNRQNFLNSVTNIVRNYVLNGVDIDIEDSFFATISGGS